MADLLKFIVGALLITMLFSSVIVYFVALAKFARYFKKAQEIIWDSERRIAPTRVTDLMVAYTILSGIRGSEYKGKKIDSASASLSRDAKRKLYVAMSTFAVVLTLCLWVSVS